MDADRLRELLENVRQGTVDPQQAFETLRRLPYSDLGYARVDHHRELRMGVPEVVLAEHKTSEQIIGIARKLVEAGQNLLITRLDADKADALSEALPSVRYLPMARVASLEQRPVPVRAGHPVAVVTAGTSDIPVAEEAAETLRLAGVPSARVFDVGVAGIHRMLGSLDVITQAPAVIVAAGMEGALPSVVGGLVAGPIIAVPTSVGYGAALNGFTALFGMLTGCASGVTVVNIDNGFGAAMAVVRMLRTLDGKNQ